jgi:hypothetical protein
MARRICFHSGLKFFLETFGRSCSIFERLDFTFTAEHPNLPENKEEGARGESENLYRSRWEYRDRKNHTHSNARGSIQVGRAF